MHLSAKGTRQWTALIFLNYNSFKETNYNEKADKVRAKGGSLWTGHMPSWSAASGPDLICKQTQGQALWQSPLLVGAGMAGHLTASAQVLPQHTVGSWVVTVNMDRIDRFKICYEGNGIPINQKLELREGEQPHTTSNILGHWDGEAGRRNSGVKARISLQTYWTEDSCTFLGGDTTWQ